MYLIKTRMKFTSSANKIDGNGRDDESYGNDENDDDKGGGDG